MATWTKKKKDFDPRLITQQINASKSFDGKKQVTFEGSYFAENILLLSNVIDLNPEIPAEDRHRTVRDAVFNAGAKGEISPESLLIEIESLEREYLSKSLMPFRLVTDISIAKSCKFPNLSTGPMRISFKSQLDKPTLRVREKIKCLARHSLFGEFPIDYTSVTVSVEARTGAAAAEKALEHLDCTRGIWNLWINRCRVTGWSHGVRNPINRILLGPLHTLHDARGNDAVRGSWWYDPNYHTPITVYNEAAKLPKMFKFTSNVRRKLHVHRYKAELVGLIVRYVRALDSRDWADSFLRLWSVLESLTNTRIGETHKDTVRKASFVFSDRDVAYQQLLHLRDIRNESVHAGAEFNEIETLLYQLKRYVEALLQFHTANKFDFASLSDAAEFLNLPYKAEDIEKKLTLYQFAKRHLSGKLT